MTKILTIKKAKTVIGEARRKTDKARQIKETAEKGVDEHPHTEPGVERVERNVHVLGHIVENGGKGKHRTCRPDDAEGHMEKRNARAPLLFFLCC